MENKLPINEFIPEKLDYTHQYLLANHAAVVWHTPKPDHPDAIQSMMYKGRELPVIKRVAEHHDAFVDEINVGKGWPAFTRHYLYFKTPRGQLIQFNMVTDLEPGAVPGTRSEVEYNIPEPVRKVAIKKPTKAHIICHLLATAGPMTKVDLLRLTAVMENKPYHPDSNGSYFMPCTDPAGWGRRSWNGPYKQSLVATGKIEVVGKQGNALVYGLTPTGQVLADEYNTWKGI